MVIEATIRSGESRVHHQMIVNFLFLRFFDTILQVVTNWWCDNDDNTIYKAVYSLYEASAVLKPAEIYSLPKLKTILLDVSNNKSTYSRWGEGKNPSNIEIDKLNIYGSFESDSNFPKSSQK